MTTAPTQGTSSPPHILGKEWRKVIIIYNHMMLKEWAMFLKNGLRSVGFRSVDLYDTYPSEIMTVYRAERAWEKSLHLKDPTTNTHQNEIRERAPLRRKLYDEAWVNYGSTLFLVFACHHGEEPYLSSDNCIVMQTEQHCSNFVHNVNHLLSHMKYTKETWEYSPANVRYWRGSYGWENKIRYVPFGVCVDASYKTCTEYDETARDIDVLFVGSPCGRRLDLLERLQQKCKLVSTHDQKNHKFGEELHDLMRRAKILINIHYFGVDAPYETCRFGEALLQCCFILTERSGMHKENDEWADILESTFYKKLETKCLQLLEQPEFRKQKAEEGRRLYLERYSYDRVLRKFLEAPMGDPVEAPMGDSLVS